MGVGGTIPGLSRSTWTLGQLAGRSASAGDLGGIDPKKQTIVIKKAFIRRTRCDHFLHVSSTYPVSADGTGETRFPGQIEAGQSTECAKSRPVSLAVLL
jgi:hypothetical protein